MDHLSIYISKYAEKFAANSSSNFVGYQLKKTLCSPDDNPFWEKSNPAKRREREKNNAVNSGHKRVKKKFPL